MVSPSTTRETVPVGLWAVAGVDAAAAMTPAAARTRLGRRQRGGRGRERDFRNRPRRVGALPWALSDMTGHGSGESGMRR
jgi:hypothetical protein